LSNDEWVNLQVGSLPTSELKQRAFIGYKEKYDEAFNEEKADHKKENTATKAANLALTDFIKRVFKT
tara:strand:+ start:270 stop:470 length:201 start_codon:yes stop_codon:yes gene_type:complete